MSLASRKHPQRLLDALAGFRGIYFLGLAKNTGKTVALRQAMNEAREADMPIAVTSVGRDGEAFDAIYPTFAKPLLYFEAGDLVITAQNLLPAKPRCTVLHRFDFASPLGPIVAARTTQHCSLEVAGPSTVSGLRAVRSWLDARAAAGTDGGARMLFVDGALDRKAASLPEVCDGVVLASGAALSGQMQDVLQQTRAAVEMLGTRAVGARDDELRIRYSPLFDPEEVLSRVLVANPGRRFVIEVPGAVTESLIDLLWREGVMNVCRIEADSFAKTLIRGSRWHEYRKLGLDIGYLRDVPVLSVTVNPVSPTGTIFDADELLQAMTAAIPEIPVFDVCSARYTGTRRGPRTPPTTTTERDAAALTGS